MVSSVPYNVTTAKKSAQHRSRRSARQLALQILFQEEFHEMSPALLEEFLTAQKASEDVRLYSSHLVKGVLAHQEELDALIERFAREWSVNRMPVVDRNILRYALFELLWLPDIPAKVTINEAIELAKQFADDESKRFVNGLLDRIIQSESRLAIKRSEMMSLVKPSLTKNEQEQLSS